MTRREFIKSLTGVVVASLIGIRWLAKIAVPRRFILASQVKKYPGSLIPLGDISQQSKWSG
jgi:hypothetical protein